MPRSRKSSLPPVALGGLTNEPALPFPFVEYPEHYGSIFRFGPTATGPFLFCACSARALLNLARLNEYFPRHKNADHRRMAPLDSLMVPKAAAEETVGWCIDDLTRLRYADAVCHRCNQIPPTMRWCHEMYGDPWKQAYGWFPYLAALEGGVDPWNISRFLPDQAPAEVRADIDEYLPLHAELSLLPVTVGSVPDHATKALRRRMQTLKSRVMRFFTSEARVAFGFKRVGEGWVSETMLFRLIQGALPSTRLIRHFRSDWLEGLELDIYAPALKLGIEYQGEQHSSPVAHWGGADAHARQTARDARKRELCKREGCTLIEVWAGTPLNETSVRGILQGSGLLLPQVT